MHTLFLTRKYPPHRGGMETFSYELLHRFSGQQTALIENTENSVVSGIILFFRALPHLKKASIIHIGDGVLAPIGALLHLISKKPVVVTVHGLELTSDFAGNFYHTCMRWATRHITHWVAVSNYTAQLARDYGIDPQRVSIITHGAAQTPQHSSISTDQAKQRLLTRYPQLADSRIILSVGRLIQRKGVDWFLRTVFPFLPQDTVLCIISDGPLKATLESTAATLHLSDRVLFCGKISDDDVRMWYQTCDLFIFPNIPTPYEVEGFGLTALEASAQGAPVYAARLHGIPDAIHDGKNGTLITPLDAKTWITELNARLANPLSATERQDVREYVRTHFDWNTSARAYEALFTQLCSL